LRTILNLELLSILCHPSEILHLPCCLPSHLYDHCLFLSYFRKAFLPQWWKHITMKLLVMDNLITPLFRKEVTMLQDLFVLYPLSFYLFRNNLKLFWNPFSIRHFYTPNIFNITIWII
jgi:hypothetical protein